MLADTQRYMQSISGLRAIAILAVILFHVNARWLPGGFVGVDVFFVISGFVVAHSVIGKTHQSFASYLAWFYRRRFLRILPAALVFISTISLLGVLFLPAGAGADTSITFTGLSAIFSVSNIYLLKSASDYFSSADSFNLFAHTWSLSIEEQYYLLFPLFSYFLIFSAPARLRAKSVVLPVVYFLCLGSLVTCFYFTRHRIQFAFFMLPARFWELGLGFLLRYKWVDGLDSLLKRLTSAIGTVVSVIMLLVLCASLIRTNPLTFPFPGALAPCFATAGILALLWSLPGRFLDRALSVRPLVYIGDISYSLYLWHWGVVVLMRWTCGLDTLALQGVAVLLTFLLGAISYRFVEQPFRNLQKLRTISPRLFFGGGVVALGVTAAVVIGLFLAKPVIGLSLTNNAAVWNPYKLPKGETYPCSVIRTRRAVLSGEAFDYVPTCPIRKASVIYVIGDSHAGAYERLMFRLAAKEGYEIHLYTVGSCLVLPVSHVPTSDVCKAFVAQAIREAEARLTERDVVFLPGLHTPRFRDAWGDPIPVPPVDGLAANLILSNERLTQLLATKANVVVEEPKPLVKTALFRCADWFNKGNPYCAEGWVTTQAEMEARRAPPLQALQTLANGRERVSFWDPLPVLCSGGSCDGFRDGKPIFFDTDHLSAYGNDLLYSSFSEKVRATAGGLITRGGNSGT